MIKSQKIIILSFSAVLLLLTFLVLFSIYSINTNQESVREIVRESEIAEATHGMSNAALKRVILLYQMAMQEDPFDRDEIWMSFNAQAGNFIKSRDSLEKLITDPSIKLTLKEALKSAQQGENIQNKTVEEILKERVSIAFDMLANEVPETQNRVLDRLFLLNEKAKTSLGTKVSSLEEVNRESIKLITILGLAAFVISFIIAAFSSYKMLVSERILRSQREFAEQASQEKTAFLANMSHEIRSPLTAIIGFSESLLRRDTDDKKKKTLTNSIIRNSKHLHQLLNDVLDISKIEAGQLEIENVLTKPSQLIKEISDVSGSRISSKGLQFRVKYQFPIPERIDTDPTRLKQVLINLLSNATKFTEQGSIELLISCDVESQQMKFIVSDTGIGMNEEQQGKIFQKFAQADSSTTRKFGGTGLGLSISKQLVEKLGGDIHCHSKINEGSQFTFTISTGDLDGIRMWDNYSQISTDAEIIYEKMNARFSGKVLLAEDTPDIQQLVAMYVTDTGAEIEIVDNGKKAIEQAKNGRFDLILMDMQMPVLDGIEATIIIREFDKVIPIISLTANSTKTDIDKCYSAGCNDFITKPIQLDNFYRVLRNHLSEGNKKLVENTKSTKSNKIQKIINRFLKDLPNRMSTINGYFRDKDFDNVAMEIHKLKSLGTSMGFPELTEMSTEIESLIHNNKLKEINDKFEELNEYVKSIL